MTEIIKTKRNYIIALAILFLFVSLSETTYSLFLTSNETEEFNYNTGSLDLELVEDDRIVLDNIFPVNDSEGVNNKTYNLTVRNTGSLTYLFDLKMISTSKDTDKVIDTKYLKVKVNDDLPIYLSEKDSIISSNNTIYPGEELSYKITIWLDKNTPNSELGKEFAAKIIASGTNTYKTLDNSGANKPILEDNLIPVYYNNTNKEWHIADYSNTDKNNQWYNYQDKMWANAIVIKNSSKKIYDITRNNDLNITNIKYNNGNLIIDDAYLDIGLDTYSDNTISNIIRIKVDNLNSNYINILSNGLLSYYYDTKNKSINLKIGNNIASASYTIEQNIWYVLGYTYDGNKVSFYANGNKLTTKDLTGNITSNKSFKIGTNDKFNSTSNITIGDFLLYNRILTPEEINKNYSISMNIINDGLLCGYRNFIPMTLKEYYQVSPLGTTIIAKDIDKQFVWIPRYKYRLWNITGESGNSSYDALNKGVDIVFENNTATTGDIHCKNNNCYSDSLMILPAEKNDNNKYYTHSAFTNNGKELPGFWVSKYELSMNNNSIEIKNDNTVTENTVQTLLGLSNNNNIIKNTEWGAIAYLAHSNYGVCSNNKCNEITPNKTNISGNNDSDSTTLNPYGVYDMAGNYEELTMSNYQIDSSTNVDNNKYDIYTSNSFLLGDATKEILLTEGIWYNNTNNYVNANQKWFIRGGNNTKEDDIFAYNAINENSDLKLTTRIILK